MCVSPEQVRLCDLEDQAKAVKKGLWSEGGGTHTIRDLKYSIENPRNFVDSMHQKPVNGESSLVQVLFRLEQIISGQSGRFRFLLVSCVFTDCL